MSNEDAIEVPSTRMAGMIWEGAKIIEFQIFLSGPQKFYTKVEFRTRIYETLNERPFPLSVLANGTAIPDPIPRGLQPSHYHPS